MASFFQKTMKFPIEIIDLIILFTDLKTAISLGNKYAKRVYKYNPLFYTWYKAARDNNFDVILFLHKNKIKGNTSSTIDYAACNGNLDMMNFLLSIPETRQKGCTNKALRLAIEHGHFDIVKLLNEKIPPGYTKNSQSISTAIRTKNIEIVYYLFENNFEYDLCSMDWAALNGNLELVEFLYEKGATCSQLGMNWACEYGHLKVVCFLSENFQFKCTTMDVVLYNGHFETWRYLSKRV